MLSISLATTVEVNNSYLVAKYSLFLKGESRGEGGGGGDCIVFHLTPPAGMTSHSNWQILAGSLVQISKGYHSY